LNIGRDETTRQEVTSSRAPAPAGEAPKPSLAKMPIQQVWKEYQASREQPARASWCATS